MNAKDIINRLIWIDAKVNNQENLTYRQTLKNYYNLRIEAYDNAADGIEALENIQFESIFVITSGSIYPEFFDYMKRTFQELRVIPFSIIFTTSSIDFINSHKYDEIGKLYNKTFFNRGGVVDNFNGVISFINEIYTNLNNFQTCNRYQGMNTKDYTGFIVFEKLSDYLPLNLPYFFKDIYTNKHIDFSQLNQFTIFFLKNFCTREIEKLLKPLILFKEVPEVIISKYWARIYTHETPFYSIMNKSLMAKVYKEYEVYIRLLYRGLACKSYRPKFNSTMTRGTKLELSEINYLKSICGTNQIIFNKSFLSFSLNKERSISFQINTGRLPSPPPDFNNTPIVQSPPIVKNPQIIPIYQFGQIPIIQNYPIAPIYPIHQNESIIDERLNCEQLPRPDSARPLGLQNSFGSGINLFGNQININQSSIIEPIVNIIPKDNLRVLIELTNINEYQANNFLMSNAFLRDISCFTKEEEVLVFPFTGFEVIRWENSTFTDENGVKVEGTHFYFKLSERYFQKIKSFYSQYSFV
jgi:hypothetical protein